MANRDQRYLKGLNVIHLFGGNGLSANLMAVDPMGRTRTERYGSIKTLLSQTSSSYGSDINKTLGTISRLATGTYFAT